MLQKMSTNSSVKETGPKSEGRIMQKSRLLISEGRYSEGVS